MRDGELLGEYIESRSEEAFAELVERHLPLVYSAALRQTRCPQSAEDVVQTVFLLLSRKAPSLQTMSSIAGWLYRTSHYIARDVSKKALRRQIRERKAAEMIHDQPTKTPPWSGIEPALDKAMMGLREPDRQVLLLRFFQKLSMREVGKMIGVSEAAAKMRVSRALQLLRHQFAKSGIYCSVTLLASILNDEAVASAIPSSFSHAVISAARSCQPAPTLSFHTSLLMNGIKWKSLLAILITSALLLTGGAYIKAQVRRTKTANAKRGNASAPGMEPFTRPSSPLLADTTKQASAVVPKRDLGALIAELRSALYAPVKPGEGSFNHALTSALLALRSEPKAAFDVLKEAASSPNRIVVSRALGNMIRIDKTFSELMPFLWQTTKAGGERMGLAFVSLQNLGLTSEDLPKIGECLPFLKQSAVHQIQLILSADPIGSQAFIVEIEKHLTHDDPEVRLAAACALARTEPRNSLIVSELEAGLKQGGLARLPAALHAIAQMGPDGKALLPALVKLTETWSSQTYDSVGASRLETVQREELFRVINILDPDAREQIPGLNSFLNKAEENEKWQSKLQTGQLSIGELANGLNDPERVLSALSAIRDQKPAEAVPVMLDALSHHFDPHIKDELVSTISLIAPEVKIAKADSKTVVNAIAASEDVLRSIPGEQETSLRAELAKRRLSLINHFTWYTPREVAELSTKLENLSPAAHAAFVNELTNGKAEP